MAAKNGTEVVIGGKVFTLGGYESEDYLQKVATYINSKIAECAKIDNYRRLSSDLQNVLLQINLADDYFKLQSENYRLEGEFENKDKELYEIKHELITAQIKLENTEKALREAQKEADERAKKIVQLETQLNARNKR